MSSYVSAKSTTLLTADQNVYHTFPIPSSSPQARQPNEQPAQQAQDASTHSAPAPIPPALQRTYSYIRECLTSQFTAQPPHTIQRLAELILFPKQHHNFLHSYLNALDRVVSVYSGLNALPNPIPNPSPQANGASAHHAPNAPDSDESLGGALLTPIPWLRDSGVYFGAGTSSPSSPGPNGANADATSGSETSSSDGGGGGGVPTPDSPSSDSTSTSTPSTSAAPDRRPAGAVTQGELLRAEQRASSPPAPIASLASMRQVSPDAQVAVAHAAAVAEGGPADSSAATLVPLPDEQPHARGPENIGLEDTGLQSARGQGGGPTVLDMQAAAGRGARAPTELKREEGDASADTVRDGDGDVDMDADADADGVPDGEDAKAAE